MQLVPVSAYCPSDLFLKADDTPVSATMTRHVVCVRPDLSIEALASLFVERGFSGVPVVDAAGFPLGVVSKTDLVRERCKHGETAEYSPTDPAEGQRIEATLGNGFHAQELARGCVADIMTRVAVTLREDESLSQPAGVMAAEGCIGFRSCSIAAPSLAHFPRWM